jgi:hypothetical protein
LTFCVGRVHGGFIGFGFELFGKGLTIMGMDIAAEYAESVAAGFWADQDAGAPFGLVCVDCGEPVDGGAGSGIAACESCGGDVTARESWDWLRDALDVEFVVGASGEYRGAGVTLTVGGPAAWIDTRSGLLRVAWGGRAGRRTLPAAMIEALDAACAELWQESGR